MEPVASEAVTFDGLGTSVSFGSGEGALVLTAVFSLLLIVVRIVLAVGLFARHLPKRKHFGLRTLTATVVVASAYLVLYLVGTSGGGMGPVAERLIQLTSFSMVLAACVGALLFLFQSSVWVALFCATAGYTVMNLATGATELVACFMREAGINPSGAVAYLANDAICLGIVYSVCYWLLARKIGHEGLTQIENHQMLLMMPVVSLAIIGFDVLIKALQSEGTALEYLVLLRLFHGLACVATLWIEYQMLYRVRVEQERATAERLLVERKHQYQLSRSTIEAINVKCHDLRHQIRSLASGGAVVDGAALGDLAREVSIYDSTVRTGNDALDTILTEKRLICEQRGITLTCIADGASLDFMAPANLYALFGNALDNAIEAVSALEDPTQRSVSLVVRQAMGCVSIHIENRFAGERHFLENGLPLTTKGDRLNHGFGTRSIRLIAEHYGGTLSVRVRDGAFCLDVMIPLMA